MRVIGVIDLRGGLAVRAAGGNRSGYNPVSSIAGRSIRAGDALALAGEYVNALGIVELYVADLDAILAVSAGGGSRLPIAETANRDVVAALARLGCPVWLDAGVSSVSQAQSAVELGVSQVVVGLETLRSFSALDEIVSAIGRKRVTFSLDLRAGVPVTNTGGETFDLPCEPHRIAARAVAAGATTVIVIDLARVGNLAGPDFELLADIHDAIPAVSLVAGGGVRGLGDVVRLAAAGCDGALVATSLQNGDLNRAKLDLVAALGQDSATR